MKIEWLEEFIDKFNSAKGNRVCVIRATYKRKSMMIYMYESCGYYNCYASLEKLLEREFFDNHTIAFHSVETYYADTETPAGNLKKLFADTIKDMFNNPIIHTT